MLPVVEAERVRLRPFRAADRDAVFALFSDPQVARYWSHVAWTAVEQAEQYLTPLLEPGLPVAERTAFAWAVADRATDECIGTTTLFNVRRDHRRGEIGYSLLARHWGRGLAREAVGRACAFGFEELQLHRIEADIDPRNGPSVALVERLGFVREGYLRERWFVGGEIGDTALFGLLARELRR